MIVPQMLLRRHRGMLLRFNGLSQEYINGYFIATPRVIADYAISRYDYPPGAAHVPPFIQAYMYPS